MLPDCEPKDASCWEGAEVSQNMLPIIRPTLPSLDDVADVVHLGWESGVVTPGPTVQAFEDEVRARLGVRHESVKRPGVAGGRQIVVHSADECSGPLQAVESLREGGRAAERCLARR
jgi:hypothetical protein